MSYGGKTILHRYLFLSPHPEKKTRSLFDYQMMSITVMEYHVLRRLMIGTPTIPPVRSCSKVNEIDVNREMARHIKHCHLLKTSLDHLAGFSLKASADVIVTWVNAGNCKHNHFIHWWYGVVYTLSQYRNQAWQVCAGLPQRRKWSWPGLEAFELRIQQRILVQYSKFHKERTISKFYWQDILLGLCNRPYLFNFDMPRIFGAWLRPRIFPDMDSAR